MWYSDGETTEVFVTHRATLALHDLKWARAVVAAASVFVFGAADCAALLGEGEEEPKPCTARCDVEEFCGFRSEADCLKASCNADGTPKDKAADDCLAAASDAEADCVTVAACACDGGCAKIDECTEGEPDAECVNTCDTLVEQQTSQTYLENRCRIEKSCEDLATCSSVSG